MAQSTSWKPAVKVIGESGWSYNGLRFATEAEALANARDLMSRWMLVEEAQAHPSDDPVNYSYTTGKLVAVEAVLQ